MCAIDLAPVESEQQIYEHILSVLQMQLKTFWVFFQLNVPVEAKSCFGNSFLNQKANA